MSFDHETKLNLLSVFQFILYVFIAYMLYRFVFGLVLPVYRTTRQVKQQFREMNSRMQEQVNKKNEPAPEPTPKKVGDYIDFEEVK